MCSNKLSPLVLWLGAALFALLGGAPASGSTFIWDPNNQGNIDTWRRAYPSFANPPVCVPIPANMSLCHGIKYSEMRLPNLLHHDSLNEVIHQSESWIQLTKLKCHSDTQLFLCSLFTPVCLDQTIPPCRSLCEAVQRGCEPFMLKHGYSWPTMMRCDQFPVDNNMCIQSLSSKPSVSSEQPPVEGSKSKFDSDPLANGRSNQSSVVDPAQDDPFYQQLLVELCKSSWVIKSGQISHNARTNEVRIKKYKLVYGKMALQAPISVSLNESNNAISESSANFKRRQKYVIMGNGKDSLLSARLLVNWNNKTAQIKKALKKVKSGDACGRKSRPNSAHLGKSKRRQHRHRQPTRTLPLTGPSF